MHPFLLVGIYSRSVTGAIACRTDPEPNLTNPLNTYLMENERRINDVIEEVLRENIKLIGEGEHTYLGTPAELIGKITNGIDSLLWKQKPYIFRHGDDVMVDIGRYQYVISLEEILKLEDLNLRSTSVSS